MSISDATTPTISQPSQATEEIAMAQACNQQRFYGVAKNCALITNQNITQILLDSSDLQSVQKMFFVNCTFDSQGLRLPPNVIMINIRNSNDITPLFIHAQKTLQTVMVDHSEISEVLIGQIHRSCPNIILLHVLASPSVLQVLPWKYESLRCMQDCFMKDELDRVDLPQFCPSVCFFNTRQYSLKNLFIDLEAGVEQIASREELDFERSYYNEQASMLQRGIKRMSEQANPDTDKIVNSSKNSIWLICQLMHGGPCLKELYEQAGLPVIADNVMIGPRDVLSSPAFVYATDGCDLETRRVMINEFLPEGDKL